MNTSSLARVLFGLHGWRVAGALLLALIGVSTNVSSQPYANPSVIDLQTAGSFRVLASASVTVGTGTTVTGDVGVSPGTTITLTGSGSVTGTQHAGDATAAQARTDLVSAYNEGDARTVDATIPTELGGTTLGRGVYGSASATFGITGTLTLSGTASDIFIFRMTTTLTTGAASTVALTGGALASNVFWLVGSSATIDGDFKGNILAVSDITQNAGSSVIDGSALAQNGSVVVGGSDVLPVQFTSFSATVHRLEAVLRWSTATETDNHGFDVERRDLSGVRGSMAEFRSIAFVPGAGTSTSARDYSYTDVMASSGRWAYRIKQIDRNGGSTIFGEVEVEFGRVGATMALEPNFPNPFNPATSIAFRVVIDGITTLTVWNLLGQHVSTLYDGPAAAGRLYQVTFDASRMPSGTYIARLESGGEKVLGRMVLVK